MTNKENKSVKLIVSSQELSEIMGLSQRRIQQLAKDKIVDKVDHNQYNVPNSIKGYVDFMVDCATPDESKSINKDKETALLTRAKRMSAEVDLQTKLGELHRASDVKDVMNTMLNNFRAKLLTLPSKIAPQIQGKNEIEVLKSIIKNEINDTLSELSDYNPRTFNQIIKELIEDEVVDVIDDVEKE